MYLAGELLFCEDPGAQIPQHTFCSGWFSNQWYNITKYYVAIIIIVRESQ